MEPVLIATNASGTDLCAVQSFSLDMCIGYDAQDFAVTFKPIDGVGGGSFLYIDGTEYGGVVDDVTTDTESGLAQYHGRTWDGILACKRIMPPNNSAYRTVSGEANGILASLVTLLDVSDVFTASTEDSGITIPSFSFDRFTDAYSGIVKMLSAGDAKLVIQRIGGTVVLSAAPMVTVSDEADSDLMDFAVTKNHRCVNHLICAGEGEGTNRVVLHLYADANGNVSTTQTLFGADEIAAFYDYNNADSTELLEAGTEKLEEYQTRGAVDISRIGRGSWGIGDTLTARDNQSGITVSTPIVGKTVQVGKSTDYQLEVEYQLGEVTRTAYASSGTAENDLAHVGDYAFKSQTDGVDVETSSYADIASVSLAAGVWVITGNINYEANATGFRLASIHTSSTDYSSACVQRINSVGSVYNTFVNVTSIVALSSTTAMHLVGWQNSGATLNTKGHIRAVRIK